MEYKTEMRTYLNKLEELFSHVDTENQRLLAMKEHYNKLVLDKQTKLDALNEECLKYKKQVGLFNDNISEHEKTIDHLKNTIRLNQKKYLEKSAEQQKVINTFRKNCCCGVSKRIDEKLSKQTLKQDIVDTSDRRQEKGKIVTELLKQDIVETPDRRQEKGKIVVELAPMTEPYNDQTINDINNSLPIVGETEYPFQSPTIFEQHGSNEDCDSSCSNSPSVLRSYPPTPEILQLSSNIHVERTKSTPLMQHNPLETSVELFNDSLRRSAKDMLARKTNETNEWLDISKSKQSEVSKNLQDRKLCKKMKLKQENSQVSKNKLSNKSKKKTYDINNDSFFNSPVKLDAEKDEGKTSISKKIIKVNTMAAPRTSSILSTNEINKANNDSLDNLDDTAFFDKLLHKNDNKPEIKTSKVVRGKGNREKLDGFACHECLKYYASDNLSEKQLKEVLKQCSKHRYDAPPPPDTPDEFWAVGFPQTQEYVEKGYLRVQDENEEVNKRTNKGQKRRLKYQ